MLKLFEVVGDVYKTMKDGSQKLLVKDLVRHSQLEMDLIDDVNEYVNDRGKIDWDYSVITHRELGSLVVKYPVKDLWDVRARQNGFIIKGFKIEEDEKTRGFTTVSEQKRKGAAKQNTGKNIQRKGIRNTPSKQKHNKVQTLS